MCPNVLKCTFMAQKRRVVGFVLFFSLQRQGLALRQSQLATWGKVEGCAVNPPRESSRTGIPAFSRLVGAGMAEILSWRGSEWCWGLCGSHVPGAGWRR